MAVSRFQELFRTLFCLIAQGSRIPGSGGRANDLRQMKNNPPPKPASKK